MSNKATPEDYALIQTVASVHTGFANEKLAAVVSELREIGIKDQTIAACQMAMALRTFIQVFGKEETLRMLQRVPDPINQGIFD